LIHSYVNDVRGDPFLSEAGDAGSWNPVRARDESEKLKPQAFLPEEPWQSRHRFEADEAFNQRRAK
jgi:hypothetical protein